MINSSLEPNRATNLSLGDWRQVRVFEPNFYRRSLTAKLKSIRSIYAPLTCLYLEFIPGLMLILTIIGYILISSGVITIPLDEQWSATEQTARINAEIAANVILLASLWCALHALFLNINARQIRTARMGQMASTTQLLLKIRRRLWVAPFGTRNLRVMAAKEINERPALERSVDETYLNGLLTVAIFRNISLIFSGIFSVCVIASLLLIKTTDQYEFLMVNLGWGEAIVFAGLHILCMGIALPKLCSQRNKQSFALAKINVRNEILTTCFAPFNWMFVGANLY